VKLHALTIASAATLALALFPACRLDTPSTTITTGGTGTRQIDPATRQPALTDAEILEVVHTATQAEIAQARLAQERVTDPRVQESTSMMIARHTEADQRVLDTATKDALTLSASRLSTSVESHVDHATDELMAQSGRDFDLDYVKAQMTEHQAVLDTIDRTLLRDASNPDVVSFLGTVRTNVFEDLEHAKQLYGDLLK
jgi:putative membrane protein